MLETSKELLINLDIKAGTPWYQGCVWCLKKIHRHSGKLTKATYIKIAQKVEEAKAKGMMDLPLIMHSDRVSQYVSEQYWKSTAKVQCSYSKKAFPA